MDVRLPQGPSTVIDLSVLVAPDLPASWPGHMQFTHKNWNWYAEVDNPVEPVRSAGPYSTNFFVMDEHCGTHMDGPTHFIPPPNSGLDHAGELGAVTGDRVELSQLWGPAVVIDVSSLSGSGGPGVSPYIETSNILEWEAEHGDLAEGEVVLWRTSWDRFYTEGEEGSHFVRDPLVTKTGPGWPAPSVEAMLHLHERGVRVAGTDAPSMGSAHDGAPVHQYALSRGMIFVEMLTNLAALPARGAYFVFLPIKLRGSTGGPGRAVALLPQ
jgi:isatin hydrolase